MRPSPSRTSPSKDLKISNVWSRTSPSEATNGVVYLTVQNTGSEANALVGVKVPSSIAGEAQLHETKVDSSGTMQMSEVDQIDLPAGKTVKLKPGGYHIMLMELAKPLTKGQTFKVTLQFESGKNQTVKATVKTTAASGSLSSTATSGSM
ncbi:MAG: copper chaperone PCu(A)C [Acidimicrobiia bacterium]